MLRRFSSRQASLYRELLKPCLAGATRYDRIAGYFQSSLLELASESLAGIPHIRIVCNTEVSAEDVKTVRMATGARCKELEEGLLRLAWNAGHFPHLVDVHGARAQQRLNVLHDLLMASGKDGHPSEEADTLRRGDELEVRRLGWAIQVRAVETLARDLRQNDWNEERTKFYQFAHSHTVLPHTEKQRLLDLALVTGTGTEAIAVFGRRVAVWDASPAHALAPRVAVLSLSIDEQQSADRSPPCRRSTRMASRTSTTPITSLPLTPPP